MNCVWQPLRVDSDMTLDPRYFFPSVITFIFSRVSIFYALSINNYKFEQVLRDPLLTQVQCSAL